MYFCDIYIWILKHRKVRKSIPPNSEYLLHTSWLYIGLSHILSAHLGCILLSSLHIRCRFHRGRRLVEVRGLWYHGWLLWGNLRHGGRGGLMWASQGLRLMQAWEGVVEQLRQLRDGALCGGGATLEASTISAGWETAGRLECISWGKHITTRRCTDRRWLQL